MCRTMAEWAVYWQALTTVFTIIVGVIGLYKVYRELERLVDQREKDNYDKENAAKLKRTEFFLNQHRRLFDNVDLYSVLCLIDDDSVLLATGNEMPDKKRKFLTFFEEIALLVKSGQINKDVAHYMFGYYATCALTGRNFAAGIDTSKRHWGLLYDFAADSREFLQANPDGPPDDMIL
ncbi:MULTISPECIES: hypothetical protein [unclassified Janthinobacterium]|uniref:hypothetical protein n=1 Tax=unclassified Janthinobacterium TaxID=2610881 RepID=UPI0012F947C3|nr:MULTISPECIES: hypothetical protein [unclassified Janthinobacterium]MEC5161679.1 hypothetical protein [Janthinobacterium sp. CG_S6]